VTVSSAGVGTTGVGTTGVTGDVAYGAGMDGPVSGRRLVLALLLAAVLLAAAGVALAVVIAG